MRARENELPRSATRFRVVKGEKKPVRERKGDERRRLGRVDATKYRACAQKGTLSEKMRSDANLGVCKRGGGGFLLKGKGIHRPSK